MFSAVYLVCVINQPCVFHVDTPPYSSYEECVTGATGVMEANHLRAAKGEFKEHTAEFQCISWEKA